MENITGLENDPKLKSLDINLEDRSQTRNITALWSQIPCFQECRIVSKRVGLRPCRRGGVRLEVEHLPEYPNKKVRRLGRSANMHLF